MCTPNKFILGMVWVGNNEHLSIKPPDKGKKGQKERSPPVHHQHKCCCEVYYPSKTGIVYFLWFWGIWGGFCRVFVRIHCCYILTVISSRSRNKTMVQGAVDGSCGIFLMTDCVIPGTARIFFPLSFFPHIIEEP